MATDAQTLVTTAASNKYLELSERDLMLCLMGFYGSNAGLNAQQAVIVVAQQGYSKLSDRQLDECYLTIIS